jgi:SecD/SecF fusion protein
MKRNHLINIIVIAVIAGLAAWYLYPTVLFYSKSRAERNELVQTDRKFIKKVINLGLDLQGGMMLVLELDKSALTKDAQKDALDRAYTIIENRINALGVAEPDIKKMGDDRLSVELPGLSDSRVAREVIGSTAQLEFKLVREIVDYGRAIRVVNDVLKGKSITNDSIAALDSTVAKQKEAQETAKMLFGGSQTAADSTAVDTTDSLAEEQANTFSDMLIELDGNTFGALESDIPKIKEILNRPVVKDALRKAGLGGNVFLWGHERISKGADIYKAIYLVRDRAEMRGDIIRDASASISQGGMDAGQWKVDLEMNTKGAAQFSRVTGANVNKCMAIVLDSSVFSAPVIRQKISQGRAEISGSFTPEEARGLAVVLRAGALPAPVKIIEERTVGPSLGDDSIKKGVMAVLISFLVIVIFMAIYYNLSGILADIALLLNVLFTIAVMASINATLTLPGIAGLILTIGMSVDANVLIFERMREELAVGKTARSALEAGYNRAFITILDSNLTTLITAFVLLWVGSGMLKGFAITLSIGIITSMFTALFVTKAIQKIVLDVSKSNKISV